MRDLLKYFFAGCLLFILLPLSALHSSPVHAVKDTLYLKGGAVLPVDILSVETSLVYYTIDESDTVFEINQDRLEKIAYADGNVEVFSLPVFRVISGDSWQQIFLTENPEDVEGLYEIGPVQVTSVAGRNRSATLRNAEVRLKRQAAMVYADVILVINTEFRGGYGDIPSITMKGLAFRSRPADY